MVENKREEHVTWLWSDKSSSELMSKRAKP